jgi:hypothetical protein
MTYRGKNGPCYNGHQNDMLRFYDEKDSELYPAKQPTKAAR